MTTASGTLSLVLGFSILVLAIGGWFFVLYLMKNKILEDARIDKLAKLGQWVIVSVSIVVTGFIVSNSFKEREAQIKELEFFDKYVATVTLAQGVEQRWLLCQYFAAVSPSGEFRSAWKTYQNSIQDDYSDFKKNQLALDSLTKKGPLTSPADSARFKILSRKMDRQKQSLVSSKDNPKQP